MEVLVPDLPDRELVHRIIFEELCRGILTKDSRARIRDVIGELGAQGAEGIILGCTEIELLISQSHCAIPVLATTALRTAAAVEAAVT